MNEWEPRAIEVVDAENIPPSLHETIGKLISTQCEMIAEAAQTPVGIAVTAAIVGILALQTGGNNGNVFKTPTSQGYMR